MNRVILHIDMDAFFAQIEQVKNPSLRGKPVVVGGEAGNRGVVSTCSYEAREYGIHSAMSSAQARKLCPHAIFIGGNLNGYVYISAQILNILHRFSPLVEPTSIDEAYLDITDSMHLYDGPIKLAQAIKQEIMKEVELTCSIGIAENKLLAKTASDMNKPDGLTTLWKWELNDKFFPLHIRKLRGVGPQTEKVLAKWDIKTIGDLTAIPEKKMEKHFGKYGVHLGKISRGIDDNPVLAGADIPDEKSMSHEHTLGEDTTDLELLRSLMVTLADKVVTRMKKGGILARTIRLRLRYADFTTITREITLPVCTDDATTIFNTAYNLIPKDEVARRKVRLLGVGVTKLVQAEIEGQTDLFGDKVSSKRKKCSDVVEGIRDKYGRFSIVRATTLPYRWHR